MKIIIIGGSIGGLSAGIALMDSGHDVHIYERSAGEMKDRGAGLVIQHDMMEYFIEQRISTRSVFGVSATKRQILDDKGRAALLYPNDTVFTSWNYIWRQLKDHFPAASYSSGFELESITEEEDTVTARFKNGEHRTADLIIGADGVSSMVRNYVAAGINPQYAGYVAYRGLIHESELSAEEVSFFSDKFSIYHYPNSHFLSYLVPGINGDLREGHRLYNWVWYQNKSTKQLEELLTDRNGTHRQFTVPAGFLSPDQQNQLYELAESELPEVLKNRVQQTPNPFVQVILDMSVPKMFKGRIAILGDAANLVRPHTASGTAKAYRDAIALAMNLSEQKELNAALQNWNKHQIRHAISLDMHGRQLATQSGLGLH